MKVKRYVADTLQEAILKVKSEMGRDAIILHTRKYREGGIMGLFAQEKVEVTAAVDDLVAAPAPLAAGIASLPIEQPRPAAANPPFRAINPPPAAGRGVFRPAPAAPEHQVAEGWPGERAARGGTVLAPLEVPEREAAASLRDELKEVKQVMQRMLNRIGDSPVLPAYPMALNRMHRVLLRQQVDEKLAEQLLKQLMNNLDPAEWTNTPQVAAELGRLMCQQLREASPIKLEDDGRQKVVVLVGPTGVGKTTTVAKLAANYHLIEKRRIALLTIDTYRIAAVEQLRTYAQIIGIPLEVVFSPASLSESLRRHADKELILVDTAGRSPKNVLQMEELHEFIKQLDRPEVYLVVSATTGMADLWDIHRRFRRLGCQKVVFTKLDEAEVFGPIFSLAAQIDERLAYYTNGQTVPDDIEVAEPGRLVELILRNGGGAEVNDQAARLRWLTQSLKYRIESEIEGITHCSRIITVTSGKGGVGKTNLALNLALALQEYGQRVIVMDADMGLANLDVITGIIPAYNLYHVISGEKSLGEILVEGPRGLKIIPGGSGIREMANLPSWRFEALIQDLHAIEKTVDILLIDTGAGISNNVLNFLLASDEVLLVTTPEPTAITDAYGLIKILRSEDPEKKLSLIVNQVASEEEARLVANKLKMVTKRFLNAEVEALGHIVWDSLVGEAVRRQEPFILCYPRAAASYCVYFLAAKMCDQSLPQPTGLKRFFSSVVGFFGRRGETYAQRRDG